MTACQVDPVACPPNRRTFNPDGTRIRDQTPEEKAAEEKVFAEGRKRWGDRVGRRPTPPPADQTTKTTSTTSNAETTSIGSDATLLPGQDGKAEGKRKGGLLARVFHRDKKEGEKEKRMDQYIAAAASWGGDEDVGGKGKGEGVRRERLGRRD